MNEMADHVQTTVTAVPRLELVTLFLFSFSSVSHSSGPFFLTSHQALDRLQDSTLTDLLQLSDVFIYLAHQNLQMGTFYQSE